MQIHPRLNLLAAHLSIVLILLLIGGCSSPRSDKDTESGNLTSQEQALGSDDLEEADDPGLIGLVCPPETITYKLQLSHTFDFSPGRQTDQMQVNGHTSSSAWCLVSVNGTKVEAEDCVVDFDFNGFIQTDEGKCDVSGSETALISFEGECLDGTPGVPAEIYLAITEIGNPDETGGGALNCPGYSGAYIGFYPPSFFVATFPISTVAASDTDDGPDLTGQFEYLKQYTLIPANP